MFKNNSLKQYGHIVFGFFAVATAALVLALAAMAREAVSPWPNDMDIALTAQTDGAWRVDYTIALPARLVDLGPSIGLRAGDWRVVTEGLVIAERGGRDVLVAAKPGRRFTEASIIVTPAHHNLAKNYEPISRFADGGFILYTGHFWPYTESGRRYDARFSIRPRLGDHVAALGEEAPAFEGWTSPFRHPAFVYAGPQRAAGGVINALIDPAAPDWATREAADLAPRLAAFFERSFGRSLDAPPDMFLAMGDVTEPGRIRYNGDALPGQFFITLSGGAWTEPSVEAHWLLKMALAHETAHLWQTAARPRGADVPAWIHEGAADAIAVEALAALGEVAPGELPRSLDEARHECAETLRGGTLRAAERDGAWRAAYACGHVLAVIAARTRGPDASVIGFWRDFVDRAQAGGGYDEDLFAAMIEEAGGARLAADVARFAHTPYAAPEKELARLLEEAGAGP